MSTVIVTGGAGFIGSHTVVELAAAGYDPVIVDDLRNSDERAVRGIAHIMGRGPRIHRIDCNDAEAMDRVFRAHAPVHGAIHFAAYKSVNESVAEPEKYFANNVGSLKVLLATMDAHRVGRLVFSSSCTVYGQPVHMPVTEDAPAHNASSPYGQTKVQCEDLLRDRARTHAAAKTVMLRYFNPIGAHPSGHIGELPLGVPQNLVPYITQTAAGMHERVVVHGTDYGTPDGSCVRDFIHVVDLARAHVRALEWMEEQRAPLCEVFNLGMGRGVSVLEALRTFHEASGVEVPWSVGPRRPGDIAAIWADTSKSREVLGWAARLTVSDALRDAWHWQQRLMGPART